MRGGGTFRLAIVGVVVAMLAPAASAAPSPDSGDFTPVVGPGGWVNIRRDVTGPAPWDGHCTLNFLFDAYREDEDGERVFDGRYIGTGGQCGPGADGETVWAPGSGPAAEDANGLQFGELAYRYWSSPGHDFGLIRIRSGWPDHADVPHVGGPTGVNSDVTASPVELRFVGQGETSGQVLSGQPAVAPRMPDPEMTHAYGDAWFGDIGAPVVSTDGRAVGWIGTFGASWGGLYSGASHGTLYISRIAPRVAAAEAALDLDLELVTAPRSGG